MAIVTSTSLWGAAASVTAPQVATAMAALSSGDELYLDKNLNISGTATIPLGGRALTLTGDHTNNAGFYRTDADLKVADGIPYTLRFTGSGSLLIENLKFDGDDVPGTFTEFEYRFIGPMLKIEDKPDGFQVRACSFTTDYAAQIEVDNCDNWNISRCEFDGTVGYNKGRNPNGSATCAIAFGDAHYITIEDNYFHDIPTECLKVNVNNFSGKGIFMPVVRNNFGLRLKRDFLDTTGGFRGTSAASPALLTGNIIVDVRGTFLDAKNITWTYQTGLFPLSNVLFRYVKISENKIFDSWNFLIFTLLDNQTQGGPTRLVTTPGDYFWEPYVPRDVEVSDNDIQNLGNYFNLHKQGLNITATGNRIRGTGGTVRIQGSGDSMRISDAVKTAYLATAPKYTETGTTTASLLTVPTAPEFDYGPGSAASPNVAPILTGVSIFPNGGPVGTTLTPVYTINAANPTPALTFEWKRGTTTIATSQNYTSQAADVGADITLTMTASNVAGTSSPAASAAVSITAAGALPSITGDTLTLLATAPT